MDRNSANYMRITVITIFGIISLVITVTYCLFLYQLYLQREDAKIINIAGRQRILNQRMVKNLLLISNELCITHKPVFQEIVDDFNEFKNNKDFVSQLPKSPNMERLFEEMQPIYTTFVTAVDLILTDSSHMATQMEIVLRDEKQLLELSNRIVYGYVDAYYVKISFFQKAILLSIAFTILLFLLAVLKVIKVIRENETLSESLNIKNKELLKVNATKDRFFEIIAHDLKSLMGGSVAFLEYLKENMALKSKEEIATIVDMVYNQEQRSYKLMENLLIWARTQSGEMSFNPKKIPLNDLVNQNIELLYDVAKKKELQIVSEIDESTQVFVDKDMISTVIRNLITNAIKYSQPKGIIRIFSSGNAVVQVTVQDFGIGMEENTLQSLFHVDKTVSLQGTAGEQGTGLGLAICLDFVKRHRGEIWAESRINVGTKFCFTIPINTF